MQTILEAPGEPAVADKKPRWARLGILGAMVAMGVAGGAYVAIRGRPLDAGARESAFVAPTAMIEAEPVAEGPHGSGHPLDEPIRLMRECQRRFAEVEDYSAQFVMHEQLDGALGPATYMETKVRHQPFSVYLKWLQPDDGQELIFVDGENDGMMLIHMTGMTRLLTGTLQIDPESPRARKGNRHTIREFGIGNLIGRLIRQWEFERRFSETEVAIDHVKLNGRRCYQITTTHPAVDDKKFAFYKTKIFIDKEAMLPIRMEGYGFPTAAAKNGALIECYTYVNLQANVGLRPIDFSATNPAYDFPRY